MTSNYSEFIKVRVTPEQKKQLEAEADAVGLKPATLLRSKAFGSSMPDSHAFLGGFLQGGEYVTRSEVQSLTSAIEALPGGSEALEAAEQARNLINQTGDDDGNSN